MSRLIKCLFGFHEWKWEDDNHNRVKCKHCSKSDWSFVQ